MTPRETRFIKTLIDSGVISFQEAAQLEQERERQGPEPGSGKSIWDLAVERGLVSPEQAQELLGPTEPGEAAEPGTVTSAGQVSASRLGGYLLVSKLGQGGMGTVYKARQESMDRLVAVKVLPRSLAKDQNFIARFLREARAAGRLSHPNVVAGIDAGFADGYYYFAMEYVEGRNLGERLAHEGALDEREAVDCARQAALGLDHAHRAGIIHRDVKPENILVTAAGRAKLCDLGLARASGEDLRVTQAGFAVGTPYYISPEQAQGLEPDARSDVYSLGCTLYHLVAGRPPFDAPNPLAIMQMHLNETAAPLGEVRRGTSRALDAVVRKMMARESADRYQTAGEVAEELEKVAAGGIPAALAAAMAARPGAARRGTTGTGRTRRVGQPRTTGPQAEAGAPTRPRPFWTRWPLLAATAGLLIVAVLTGMLLGRQPPEAPVGPGTGAERGTAPDPAQAEKLRLKRLAEDFELIRTLEERNPGDYAKLIERYTAFLGRAAGTEYEPKTRAALYEVHKRQEVDQSAERLRKLTADFAAVQAYEQANPEAFTEVLGRYAKFADAARGTDYEGRARQAAEAARKRRTARLAELLAGLRRRLDQECAAGNFGKALEAVAGFPESYAADAREELGRLREQTQAAGEKRWQELLTEGRNLAKAGKHQEAAERIAAGRSLGLPGLEAQIAAALSDVEKAREGAEQAQAAEARRKYEEFSARFSGLLKAGKFAEARQLGEAAGAGLAGELAARVKSDAALAGGAETFLTELRSGLARQKAGAFRLNTPMGVDGTFQRYVPETDRIELRLPAGSTSLKLADLGGAELLALARRCAGGELSPEGARRAACYLLASGKPEGAPDLVAAAKRGGLAVADLEERLAILGRGAHEVEAEKLLAEFDRSFQGKSWAGAASAGARLLKDYADTAAVKGRADLAALVEQARNQGSPVRVYTLTLQEGAPVPEAGLASYQGTRSTSLYHWEREKDVLRPEGRPLMQAGGGWTPLVQFAVLRREGGPLPDDAEILEARLSLCKVDPYLPMLEARRLLKDWSDNEVTMASAARGVKWDKLGGDVEDKPAATCDPTEGPAKPATKEKYDEIWKGTFWYELDVTESLRQALKDGRNYGWRFDVFRSSNHDGHLNVAKFAGRLYDKDQSQRPKLMLKVRCRALPGTGAGGGPVQKVLLQDGQPVGGAPYAGTRDTHIEIGGMNTADTNWNSREAMYSRDPMMRILIRFAVFQSEGGPVPDGAEIVAAKLRLFKSSAYESGPAAHEVLKDWDELQATYNSPKKGQKWEKPGCDAAGADRAEQRTADCLLGYDPGQWAELNVTESLRAWSARQRPNYGWVLLDVCKDTQNIRQYRPREHKDDPAKRPALEIEYRTK